MSAETEQVFSDTKIYLSASRNRLGVDIAEAQGVCQALDSSGDLGERGLPD